MVSLLLCSLIWLPKSHRYRGAGSGAVASLDVRRRPRVTPAFECRGAIAAYGLPVAAPPPTPRLIAAPPRIDRRLRLRLEGTPLRELRRCYKSAHLPGDGRCRPRPRH